MIQKITSYDLLQIPIKCGQIYYVTDTRCLYKDMGYTRNERMRQSAIILNTDYERNCSIRPQNGKQYYVIENNFLWRYDTKWYLIDGDIKQYNAYGYSSLSSISPVVNTDDYITSNITGDRIIDNNGLLGDGSVVVRDGNRIIKARAHISSDNSIAIQSYLDNGFSFYPYSLVNSSVENNKIGSLHLSVDRKLEGDSLTQTLNHKGKADYYGDFNIHGTGYIIKEVDYTKYNLTTIPQKDQQLTFTFNTSLVDKSDNGITYTRYYNFTINVIDKNSATIRIVTYTNLTSPATVNDAGQIIYNGPTQVESDITYDTSRNEISNTEVAYTVISTGEIFTLVNSTPYSEVIFSDKSKYSDSADDIVAQSKLLEKREFLSMLEILRVD